MGEKEADSKHDNHNRRHKIDLKTVQMDQLVDIINISAFATKHKNKQKDEASSPTLLYFKIFSLPPRTYEKLSQLKI